jgi:hypothetical protein
MGGDVSRGLISYPVRVFTVSGDMNSRPRNHRVIGQAGLFLLLGFTGRDLLGRPLAGGLRYLTDLKWNGC